MSQSREELERHLREQLSFLERSAESFDNGFEEEAKRLAVVVRTLVHDTPSSHSLLEQLGLKTKDFYDTAMDDFPENLLGHGALVQVFFSPQGSKYVPLLDDPAPDQQPRWSTFDNWWNRSVFRTSDGLQLSRRALILALANKDGGAHVDTKLDSAYAAISRNHAIGWIFSNGELSYAIRAPELAAGRQIAHEILKTFNPGYTKRPDLPPTGVVVAGSALFKMDEREARQLKRRPTPVLPLPRRTTPSHQTGRNQPCPCGSGVKFKRCHGK